MIKPWARSALKMPGVVVTGTSLSTPGRTIAEWFLIDGLTELEQRDVRGAHDAETSHLAWVEQHPHCVDCQRIITYADLELAEIVSFPLLWVEQMRETLEGITELRL